MAIIGYQLFIALSLLLVRFLAPQRLLLVCYIWTGFTVLNLFYWPLIIVQLLVVWIMYGVLSPDETRTTESATSSTQEPEEIPIKPKQQMSKMSSFSRAIEQFRDDIEIAHKTLMATMPIDMQVATERSLINAAISAWERKLETDNLKMSPEEKRQWDATYERAMNYMQSNKVAKAKPDQDPVVYEKPEFNICLDNFTSEESESINRKIKSIADAREQYLSGLIKKMKGDKNFSAFLLKELNQWEGGQVLCDLILVKLRHM